MAKAKVLIYPFPDSPALGLCSGVALGHANLCLHKDGHDRILAGIGYDLPEVRVLGQKYLAKHLNHGTVKRIIVTP
jgi:hypothetical protein